MSTSAVPLAVSSGRRPGVAAITRTTFADTPQRTLQSVLGVIWLLDGGLQFQSFMYSHGFTAMLAANASGQPGWAHASILWSAHIAGRDLPVWNSLFASLQVLIGVLLLIRPTARLGLVLNGAWALAVWWFGEGFGLLLMPDMAAPLSGAPGCVVYLLVGLLAWPSARPGGLLDTRGARTMWAALWLLTAWLWLEPASSGANAVHDMITAAPSGMSWLSSLQDGAATLARGNGEVIALVLAGASAAIGVGVAANWRARQFLLLAVLLELAFWLVGQGLGGIAQGGATDPNTAPLIILLAYGLLRLAPRETRPTQEVAIP